MELVSLLGEAHLLIIEPVHGVVLDVRIDRALHQHVAEDPLAGGGEATLGERRLLQATVQRLAREQLLVDHVVEHAAKQVGAGIERLAFADQPLLNRLALDVRGPDRLALDPGHRRVAGLGRTAVLDRLVVAAGQENERRRRGGE